MRTETFLMDTDSDMGTCSSLILSLCEAVGNLLSPRTPSPKVHHGTRKHSQPVRAAVVADMRSLLEESASAFDESIPLVFDSYYSFIDLH